MTFFDLKIPEDQLEEFEAWFDEHAGPTSKRDTKGFGRKPGLDAVTYAVRVTFRSDKMALSTRERWGAFL